jgi:N12 class adenine-specific DNA methylase
MPHSQIVTYFPRDHLFLKAVIDPETVDDLEAADDNENLVVSIVTHMRAREALERLKQFYKDWWLKAPNRGKIKEKISFNLECV